MAGCLRDAGWDASVDADGQIQQSHSVEQDDAYVASVDACYATVGHRQSHKLTPEQFHILYQHELVTRQCLADHGYPPVGDPPSEEQYAADYYNGGWFAWSVVPAEGVSAEDLDRLNEECPQVPEELEDR